MRNEKKYGKPPCAFKVDISLEKYEILSRQFKEADTKDISYLYFDAGANRWEAKLFNLNLRLRVRVKDGIYSLELKNKTDNFVKDFSQIISFAELGFLFQGILPEGAIRNELSRIDLLIPVYLIGVVHTIRTKKFFHGGVLVLEKNTTTNQVDYQLEFRSTRAVSSRQLKLIKNELGIFGPCLFVSKLKRVWALKV